VNDSLTSCPSTIANEFNRHFVNVGPSLASKIPTAVSPNSSHYLDTVRAQPNSCVTLVTQEEVGDILKNLKDSSPGWDNIIPKVLRAAHASLSLPLYRLISASLQQGAFPRELKIAKVIPFFKSGNQPSILNYRPISVLSVFSKIFETVVTKSITKFLEKYDILCNEQFGFRKFHSTSHALNYFVDEVSNAVEKKETLVSVFLDLSKAFDTLNHRILLDKLHSYGIRGPLHQWVTDFLSNRKQFISFHSTKSIELPVSCGVPQGSTLSPLLFLLYINDVVHVSSSLKFILFADDTSVFLSGKDINQLINTLNSELSKLYTWLCINKLSLNIKKTHFMTFNSRQSGPSPCIHSQPIEKVSSSKFLGVTIDSNLRWDKHIAVIKSKISKNIGAISKTRHLLSLSTLKTLYYSFVFPYLFYCIDVWGKAATCYLNSLLRLQKLCCRLILNVPPRTESRPLFSQLSFLTISNIYSYSVALCLYKLHHGLLPPFIRSFFSFRSSVSYSFFRFQSNLIVPFFRTSFSQRTLRYSAVVLWNKLAHMPAFTFNCSLSLFKKKIKFLLLSDSL